MTTIDEKVEAVEEFLEWRENTDPLTSPDRQLEAWRAALTTADVHAQLAAYRLDAAFALGNPDDALKLAERIVGGV